MSDSVDAHILEYHNQGATRDMICSLLHIGPNRVSRVLNFFWDHHQLPPRVGKGRPKKVARDILDFINIRTIQSPQQFDEIFWKCPGQQTHLDRKLNEKDNQSKSYQRCESSEKLNKKGILCDMSSNLLVSLLLMVPFPLFSSFPLRHSIGRK
jgi:hypothetical protein